MARILLIDDDQDFLLILSSALKKDGHELLAVNNGVEIVQDLRKFKPDLVITDIIMPGITGGAVYHAIREEMGPSLPVIISSATRMQLKENDSLMDYSPKPIDFDQLRETVNRLLKMKSILHHFYLSQEDERDLD